MTNEQDQLFKEMAVEWLKTIQEPDGSLICDCPWIRWHSFQPEYIAMDGKFTTQQIEAVVNHARQFMLL